jgi:hypothetical protein
MVGDTNLASPSPGRRNQPADRRALAKASTVIARLDRAIQ